MQATSDTRTIGCIGKCTSGLSNDELDQITDNIHRTLNHPRGRKIFRVYLERRDLRDNLQCLDLYEECSSITSNPMLATETSLKWLLENVKKVEEMADDLDGVQRLDMAYFKRCKKALNSKSRTALLDFLVETENICRDHLSDVHSSFKKYASEPCPITK